MYDALDSAIRGGAMVLAFKKTITQELPGGGWPRDAGRAPVTNSGLVRPSRWKELTRRNMTKSTVQSSFDHDILQSPVPVLVDFWAPWCGPCRVQLPIVDEISHSDAARARVVKINVDEQPELAMRFGVTSIPTLLVFSKGQLRKRFVGVQLAATLRTALGAAADE